MILLFTTLSAFAQDAEAERLMDEYGRYVADGKWSAVERTYQRLLEDHAESITAAVHHSASKAARQRGDMLLAAQRLLRCNPTEEQGVQDDLSNLESNLGLVMLVGTKLSAQAMPFAPDLRQSVLTATATMESQGHFVGLLPAGTYLVDGHEVTIAAGFRWQDAWVQ